MCWVHSYGMGMWLYPASVVRDHCGKFFRKATVQYICSPHLYVWTEIRLYANVLWTEMVHRTWADGLPRIGTAFFGCRTNFHKMSACWYSIAQLHIWSSVLSVRIWDTTVYGATWFGCQRFEFFWLPCGIARRLRPVAYRNADFLIKFKMYGRRAKMWPFSLQSALLLALVAIRCNRELHNTQVLCIKI